MRWWPTGDHQSQPPGLVGQQIAARLIATAVVTVPVAFISIESGRPRSGKAADETNDGRPVGEALAAKAAALLTALNWLHRQVIVELVHSRSVRPVQGEC
jgi:hypothetical protein